MKEQNCMGGCSSKLDNNRLQKILTSIGIDTTNNEDCSVHDLGNGLILVESLDFFPQISDNYYDYGRITACNSISDIYAMGAKPSYALNILSVTKDMNDEDIAQVIKGMNDILKPLNIQIKGGHSIITDELLCGLSVAGFAKSDELKLNDTINENDIIVISKPLGFGVSMAAKAVDLISDDDYNNTINFMATPNNVASELAIKYNFNSLTDVTGFGLGGHLIEMVSEHKFSAEINYESLPILKHVEDLLSNYIVSGASANNRRNYKDKIHFNKDSFVNEEIFFDPQTSGGLMGTLSSQDWDKLKEEKNNPYVAIGKVIKLSDKEIMVNN